MPFLDHLEELRWRILWSVIAIFVGALVGFVVVHQLGVLQILIDPIVEHLPEGKLLMLSPTDGFFVTLKLGLVVGLEHRQGRAAWTGEQDGH